MVIRAPTTTGDSNASEWKRAQVAQLMAESRAVIKVPVTAALPRQHRDTLERALRNVLATEAAQITYAQIIDGFPIRSVANDRNGCPIDSRHPVYQSEHDTLCPGAWERMKEFHASFNIDTLALDEEPLHAYSAESVGSRAFRPRLFEVTAAAVHELGVMLHNAGDLQLHDDWKSWKPPSRYIEPYESEGPPPEPYPTLFYHTWFQEHAQYPDGVADMVGYWAENRILGGVVLFDRGESGTEYRDVYFHSDRWDVTKRIFALTDDQKAHLHSFLTNTSDPPPNNGLPILGDNKNRVRVDPEVAVFGHHVYRNKWERPVIDESELDRYSRCVQTPLDYPEILEDGYWGQVDVLRTSSAGNVGLWAVRPRLIVDVQVGNVDPIPVIHGSKVPPSQMEIACLQQLQTGAHPA